jgi:hypothetical protein
MFSAIISDDYRIYGIDVCINNRTVKFKCSYLLLMKSIETLGNMIKKDQSIKKLTMDYTKIDYSTKNIEYLKHDILIARYWTIFLKNSFGYV